MNTPQPWRRPSWQGKNLQKSEPPMVVPAPGYVQLYPTVRCNQRCFFCFNASYSRQSSSGRDTLKDLSFRESLELLHILADQGTGEIDIMGGEPMLMSWMPGFAKKAGEMGFKVNISTNGSRPERIVRLEEGDSERITVGLSLEGSTEKKHNAITGSSHFSLAMDTIDTILSLGLDMAVKTVVSRTTMPDIPNIIRLLREMGVRRYYLIHMDVLTRKRAMMKESLSYPEFSFFHNKMRDENRDMEISDVSASCFTKELIGSHARCSGGVNKLSILPDGSAFPCNLFHRFPEFCVGNILHGDFSSLWSNARLDIFRKPPGLVCSDIACTNRNSCTGGCPAHIYHHYGRLSGCDVRCESSLASA